MLLSIVLASAAPLTLADIPNPRERGSWIADTAAIVPAVAEQGLDARLDQLRADLGVELAVVTATDVDGDAKTFANALFNRWGVGSAQANNGVLFLVVTGSRRTEIEVGYGLESVLTDAASGRILDEYVVPRFRRGDLAGGIEAGVLGIEARIRSRPDESRAGTDGPVAVERAAPASRGNRGLETLFVLGGGGTLGLGGLAGTIWYTRRRDRACPTCGKPMQQLDEEADDAHLDAGQRAEEAVGSVDRDVYACPEDGAIKALDRTRWFSGFRRCDGCGYRTARRATETLVAATYDHGGSYAVHVTCSHCPHTAHSTHTTARLQRSSTSGGFHSSGGRSGGSRGGGGFGGGRSGGGGAGRSW